MSFDFKLILRFSIKKLFFLLIVFYVIFPNSSFAYNNFLKIDPYLEKDTIYHHAYYFKDYHNLSWLKVLQLDRQKWFKSTKNFYNFSYEKANIWIRVDFYSMHDVTKYLLTSNALQDYIDLYFIESDNEKLLNHFKSGDRVKLSEKIAEDSRVPAFKLEFKKNKNFTILLKLSTKNSIHEIGNLSLYTEQKFKKVSSYENIFYGMYYGACFAIVFINIFLYLFIKDKYYIYYSNYLLIFFMQNLFFTGNASFYFLGKYPNFNNIALLVFWYWVIIAIWNLLKYSFDIKEHYPRATQVVSIINYIGLALVLYAVMYNYKMGLSILLAMNLFNIIVFAFIIMFFTISSNEKSLGYVFFLGSGALILGTLYYVLSILNVIESSFLSLYAINLGSTVEFFIVSLSIGQRIVGLQKKLAIKRHSNELILRNRVRSTVLAFNKSNKALKEITELDELTQVYNRRKFQEDIFKFLSDAGLKNVSITFAILDLDYFKKLNDTYGHDKGDYALSKISKTISSQLIADNQNFYRIGGEEFVILLQGLDLNESNTMLSKLREIIENLKIENIKSPYEILTASIGGVFAKTHEQVNYNLLYSMADKNLYRTKDLGRNAIILTELSDKSE